MEWLRSFREVGKKDLALVGGKNASLGEMIRELGQSGVRIPDGFAITANAFRHYLETNHLNQPIAKLLSNLDPKNVEALRNVSQTCREMILSATVPPAVAGEIALAYRQLGEPFVAVRSSATAEDLPGASFAGEHESFLLIHGLPALLTAVQGCYASLFTARAISYRRDMGFGDTDVALSVGVQRMVRSDRASAGVLFTLDTETGFRDVILITGSFGLGESVVQGRVVPDEIYVHKPTLAAGAEPILWQKLGSKESKLVYDEARQRLRTEPVSPADRKKLVLSRADILELARFALTIEKHYDQPMDIEWAKDGDTGEIFIVQARPETVHSKKTRPTLKRFHLRGKGPLLLEGLAVGEGIGTGSAHVIPDPRDMAAFRDGEVLITDNTDPDWEPIMKRAGAIITARGGRTSHAAIVAREIGIPAIVGAPAAMTAIPNDTEVTVACTEGAKGQVFAGRLPFEIEEIDPATLPKTRTRILLNLAQPEKAFRLAMLPCDGVGLVRMEFIFAGWIGIHPLALTRYATLPLALRRAIDERTSGYSDKTEFFIDKLSQGIGTLAAAFYPRPVIVRFSDFKTNEYANLLGGAGFEPHEQNPMLGWRGASRYYHPDFRDGFELEVAAIRRVREQMGLKNLAVMVPFCRTPEEGKRVLEVARAGGLVRGQDGLQVYVMAEIPSNIILADRFAELFDGFSIGSNDLTQLILGVDRDSQKIASLFDERNEAVKRACASLIEVAHRAGAKVGICGQAPSDYPEFAAFLVEQGIDSISLSPDALVPTRRRIAEVEAKLKR